MQLVTSPLSKAMSGHRPKSFVGISAIFQRLHPVRHCTPLRNEQVKRNAERFPEDFLFQLNRSEIEALNRSQSVTGSQKHRDPRFPPFAFTADISDSK
jgi:ORF6N domain